MADMANAAARARGGKKTNKSVRTRQRIMDMAAQIMIERGDASFQMSEVSDRCSMSKGALYYYFDDRDDLVRAIFDRCIDDLVADIDAVVAESQTAAQALRNTCRVYAERVHEGSPLALALMHELIQSRAGFDGTYVARIRHIIQVVSDLLELAKEEGAVRADVNSHMIAVAVCGAFAFTAVGTAESFADELYDSIVRGIG